MYSTTKKAIQVLMAIILLFGGFVVSPAKEVQAAMSDLIISEYIEGSSFNKAIEIYNGTGQTVDLKNYVLSQFMNGGSIAKDVFFPSLETLLPSGDVYVIASNQAAAIPAEKIDHSTGLMDFNGDDAIVLYRKDASGNRTVIDSIGKVGEDPGTSWGVSPFVTANQTLIRLSTVCIGDTVTDDAYTNLDQVWDSKPVDTFSFLGSHTANCTPTGPTLVSSTPADGATDVPGWVNVQIEFSEQVVITSHTFTCNGQVFNSIFDSTESPSANWTLKPLGELPAGKVCTITIPTTGTTPNLAAEAKISFTVEVTKLVSSVPAIGEMNVDPETDIVLTFDHAQTSLISGRYALYCDGVPTNDSGTFVQTDTEGKVWTYNPSTNLPAGGLCEMELSANATTPVMEGTLIVNFHVKGLSLVSSDPASNSMDVPVSSSIVLTFSEAITSLSGYSLVCNEVGQASTATQTDTEGKVWTIDPTNELPGEVICNLVVDKTGTTPNLVRNGFVTFRTANSAEAPFVQSVVPLDNTALFFNQSIFIDFSEEVTVTYANVVCDLSGSHTVNATIGDLADPTKLAFNLTTDVPYDKCVFTLPAGNVTDVDDGLHLANDVVLNYSLKPDSICGDPYSTIMSIQGSGAASPLDGKTVITEGVVTGAYEYISEAIPNKKGYFIQDPNGDNDPATSDGVFVFTNKLPSGVKTGDNVRVTGTISEYYGSTQVTSSSIAKCATAHTITPTNISLPLPDGASYEQYEGMLVQYAQPLVISEYFNFDRYGEVLLTSKRYQQPTAYLEPSVATYTAAIADYQANSIALDDGNTAQNPAYLPHPAGGRYKQGTLLAEGETPWIFRGGDKVSGLVAVMDYANNAYKLQPYSGGTYIQDNPRPTVPEIVPGEIRVTAFNALNLFTTLGSRGAATATELDRQLTKLSKAIYEMDADVIGLMEIENNDTDSAMAALVDRLNTLAGGPVYNYVPTGLIGTDEIKVGVIYRTTNVEPLRKADNSVKYAVIPATFPGFDTTRNRPALAVSFQDKNTDEIFTLVVNHLKSKGTSGCPTNLADPNADQGDGQGCFNGTRTSAATALVDWLATDPTDSGSPNMLIMGDLNSYAMEDPIDAIKLGPDGMEGSPDDYINMVSHFDGTNSYGYVFNGMTGYLDHALANRALASYVLDTLHWNINADEADVLDFAMGFKPDDQDNLYQPDKYRSSDHDPIIVSLLMNHQPQAVDDHYATPADTTLTVAAPGVLDNDIDPNKYETKRAFLIAGTGPSNGTLTLNEDGSFTYVPNTGYMGIDSFEYKMSSLPNLAAYNESSATVTIKVGNNLPTATPLTLSVPNDEPLSITLPGTDLDGEELTFTILTQPASGTLSGTAPNLIYTPEPGFVGTVTFTYQLYDGYGNSEIITVTIVVTAPNNAPMAQPLSLKMTKNGTLNITLSGGDPDDDALVFEIVGQPTVGTLSGTPPMVIYTPPLDYLGQVTFTYRAFDGTDYSEVVTVTITVEDLPYVPPTGGSIFLPIVTR